MSGSPVEEHLQGRCFLQHPSHSPHTHKHTGCPADTLVPLRQCLHRQLPQQLQVATQEVQAEEAIAEEGPATTFRELDSRGLVHRNVVDTITRQMKIETMTDVQQRTINEALSGVDMYGIAPAPAIQNIS